MGEKHFIYFKQVNKCKAGWERRKAEYLNLMDDLPNGLEKENEEARKELISLKAQAKDFENHECLKSYDAWKNCDEQSKSEMNAFAVRALQVTLKTYLCTGS